MNRRQVLIAGLTMMIAQNVVLSGVSLAASDPGGKCYGVVGAHEGECGGRNPANGETWGCAGQNPTADLGWKQMKKSECEALPKHADATKKTFVADSK